MKICILTQPLHTNYGGLLQAYALQTVLREMGHEVLTEDRQPNKFAWWRKVLRSSVVRTMLGLPRYLTAAEHREIRQHTSRFIAQNIHMTEPIDSPDKSKLISYGFDGYVVGSDQVWRKAYSDGIENYFLDFASEQSRKVAYAASFGLSEWEYSPAETRRLVRLAQRFDLVTVREEDAVALCREHLNVAATQVLDPTLLLGREHYEALALASGEQSGGVVSYLLDPSERKKEVVQHVAQQLSLTINDVSPRSGVNTVDGRPLEERVAAPVEQWLSSLLSAEYVVTDSFHGVAFAILFNRPFVAISNPERGASRISSLLNLFGLSDRLVGSNTDLEACLSAKIEFGAVNEELQRQRELSIELLRRALA